MKSSRFLTVCAIFLVALSKFAEVKVLQQDDTNGTTSENLAAVPFIIGGSEAAKNSWPWQLSLYHFDSHQCGAMLLSKRYVLTAAHCVTGLYNDYSVKLGAHDLNKRDWEATIGVRSYIKHPNHSRTADGKPNDIAVVELVSDAQFTAKVQPVNLTRHGYSFVGAECYITGWGRTDPYVVYPPPPFQEARAHVISNEDCSVRMSGVTNGKIHDSHVCVFDSNRRVGSCTEARTHVISNGEGSVCMSWVSSGRIHGSQMCVFDNSRRVGSCKGDSGGPLSCRFPGKANWVVVGVSSWGVSSCSTNYPSVNTRVSSFTEWIVDNTGGQASFYPPEPDSLRTEMTSQRITQAIASQPHSTTKADTPQTTTYSSFITQGMTSQLHSTTKANTPQTTTYSSLQSTTAIQNSPDGDRQASGGWPSSAIITSVILGIVVVIQAVVYVITKTRRRYTCIRKEAHERKENATVSSGSAAMTGLGQGDDYEHIHPDCTPINSAGNYEQIDPVHHQSPKEEEKKYETLNSEQTTSPAPQTYESLGQP